MSDLKKPYEKPEIEITVFELQDITCVDSSSDVLGASILDI